MPPCDLAAYPLSVSEATTRAGPVVLCPPVASVAHCLRLPALGGAEVVSGDAGLGAPVRRVSTASQARGCAPGEFRLLTRLLDGDAVCAAGDSGAAALAAPLLSPEAVTAGTASGVPVIRLPSDVELEEVATALLEFVIGSLDGALRRLGDVTARLAATASHELRIASVATTLAAATGTSVLVEDAEFRTLCAVGDALVDHNREMTIHAGGTPAGFRASTTMRVLYTEMARTGLPARLQPDPSIGMLLPRLVAPILAAGEVLGYCNVILPDDDVAQQVTAVALEQAVHLCALALLHQRTCDLGGRMARVGVLVDLLDGRLPAELLRARAAQLGVDLDGAQAVALFAGAPEQRSDAWLRHAQTLLPPRSGHMVDVVGGVVVALLVGADRSQALRWLEDLRGACGGGTAVLGREADLAALPTAYREARRTFDLMARSGTGNGGVVDVQDLGLLGILIEASADGSVDRFWRHRLAPLREYDAREGTDLCGSVAAYLEEGGLRRAARRLGVHANSLAYRLRRAEEIGGFSLGSADVRVELQMALRCRRLLGP
jgi:PucR C-terminal helix-turn-helix domain/GGDEF-like domain